MEQKPADWPKMAAILTIFGELWASHFCRTVGKGLCPPAVGEAVCEPFGSALQCFEFLLRRRRVDFARIETAQDRGDVVQFFLMDLAHVGVQEFPVP